MNNSHKAQDQIVNTLFEVLNRADSSNISINEVVEASKVARSSFYRYFNNIEDIVSYYFSSFYVQIDFSYHFTFQEHIGLLLASFKKMKSDSDKLLILFSTGYIDVIERHIWTCLATCNSVSNNIITDLDIRTVVYAYMTSLTKYIFSNFQEDIDEIKNTFTGIIELNSFNNFKVNRKTIPVISVENMRESDAYTIKNFTPSKELMFKAGESVYKSTFWQGKIAIVCGKGNNAGDGYVLAKLLYNDLYDVKLFLVEEKFSEDGLYYFNEAAKLGVHYELITDDTSFEEYDVVVDALLGTGFKGDVRGNIKTAIEKINESKARVISIDINSGLNGDNGLTSLAVISDLTVSIGNYKTGHFLNMAKDYMKEKINVDIGIKPIYSPYYLLGSNDAKQMLKERKNMSNKGSFGYIALIGGSKLYSGAIRLANLANSAMKSGAGVVLLAAPESISDYIIPNILESTIYPMSDNDGFISFNKDQLDNLMRRCKTIAIGMGMGLTDDTQRIVDYLLTNYAGNLIIDADALNALSRIDANKLKFSNAKVILTPHIKEFSRLTNENIEELQQNPIENAVNYAKDHNCIVLLKGSTTIVTDGNKTYLVDRGCAGMATAGSGDVLSGILSSIVSYNPNNLLLATATGAYINGLAGEIANQKNNDISMVASDTVNSIKTVINTIRKR